MDEELLYQNHNCTAQLPVFRKGLTLPTELVSKAKTLLVASWTLQNDLVTCLDVIPVKDHLLFYANLFLPSAARHANLLIGPIIEQLEADMRQQLLQEKVVEDMIRNNKSVTAMELLHAARHARQHILHRICEAEEKMGISGILIKEGPLVPTASPRELLFQVLVNQPEVVVRMLRDAPASIGQLNQHISILKAPESESSELEIKGDIPDGLPKMFFLCLHRNTSRAPFIIGANEENWGELTETRASQHISLWLMKHFGR